MRENRTSGSGRGVLGNRHSYREIVYNTLTNEAIVDNSNRINDENTVNNNTAADQKTINESDTSMADLINVIADRVDPVINIIRTFAENNLKSRQSDSKFRIHMAWIAVTVVAIIVGVATFLTFVGKLDGSTYGFLLGLILGYMLTFIRDAIKPNKEE
jgi:hypothetical protein